MKRLALMALAAGTALAAATPASAGIFIGISINGGAITQVASDGGTLTTAGSGTANYNTTTGGYFYNVSSTGFPLLAMPQLLTQSVNIASLVTSNDVVDVYISMTGLTSPTPGLRSTFTSNSQSGLTAELTSYYSASNALFSGTQLYDATFSPSANPQTSVGTNPISVNGLWSETVRYQLSFTGGNGSNFNGTANLAAVPEAATWGMMILGFGVIGGVMRRRKTSVAFA